MDAQTLDSLLNMSESESLDFKRDQYIVERDGGNDASFQKDRGELIKDILALANAWRTTDGYIVIGVDEENGRCKEVVGVGTHLRDANLQELVTKKTNRPIIFNYEAVTVGDKTVGVIRVALQERPFFLKADFGPLKKQVVYIRRGSSTHDADPDDIAKMGAARVVAERRANVEIAFGDPEAERGLGDSLVLTSTVLNRQPADAPSAGDAVSFTLKALSHLDVYKNAALGPDAAQRLEQYRKACGLVRPTAFLIKNSGPVHLQDARLKFQITKSKTLLVMDEKPREPHYIDSVRLAKTKWEVSVESRPEVWAVTIPVGKLRPHDQTCTQPFWIGSEKESRLTLRVELLDENLSPPVSAELSLEFAVETAFMEG